MNLVEQGAPDRQRRRRPNVFAALQIGQRGVDVGLLAVPGVFGIGHCWPLSVGFRDLGGRHGCWVGGG
jgi:hypothetical protein